MRIEAFSLKQTILLVLSKDMLIQTFIIRLIFFTFCKFIVFLNRLLLVLLLSLNKSFAKQAYVLIFPPKPFTFFNLARKFLEPFLYTKPLISINEQLSYDFFLDWECHFRVFALTFTQLVPPTHHTH